jgi:hypothetical protein
VEIEEIRNCTFRPQIRKFRSPHAKKHLSRSPPPESHGGSMAPLTSNSPPMNDQEE